jgi:hypothetical protein
LKLEDQLQVSTYKWISCLEKLRLKSTAYESGSFEEGLQIKVATFEITDYVVDSFQ